MLRREPTVLGLASDDISELQEHLEEYKLQREIKAQHKNLIRTSAKAASRQSAEEISDPALGSNDANPYSLHNRSPSGPKGIISTAGFALNEPNSNTANTQDISNPFYTAISRSD